MMTWRVAFAGLFLWTASVGAAQAADCDRACLYGYLDQYLAAIDAQDPSTLPVADDVKFSENAVEMPFPEGMWISVDGRTDYDLRFADEEAGQVGIFTVVTENGNPAILALRMKIEGEEITEIETIMGRYEEGRAFPSPMPQSLYYRPILHEDVPEDQRTSREDMVAAANGYFSTLELNDGTLHTEFDPRCNRLENGVQTTNNEAMTDRSPYLAMGCQEQFELGMYRYDDRLRNRRFPIVDQEKGLVLSAGFIDHKGALLEFELTNGETRKTNYRTPHTYHYLELFKVIDGKIAQVEAVFITVPYFMASPFDE